MPAPKSNQDYSVGIDTSLTAKCHNSRGLGYQPASFPADMEAGMKDEMLRRALNADYIFVGIGALNTDRQGLEFDQYIRDTKCVEELKQAKAIGEIAYQPIDGDGKFIL